MSEGTALESGSKDGYSVSVGAEVDETSFQKANRNVSGLEDNLRKLSKVDFSAITGSIKAIAAGAAGIGVFTVKTNFDEVQNMLKAAKAGLTNDAFKRWTTVEMQLGLNKGALTKDLASIYEQVAKIRTKGDLNKEQFLSLGLTGANAEAFLNEEDMTKRVMMVMDLAMKSDRPINETASLLSGGLGESFSDLFYLLKLSGKSFDELFQKVTVFTDAASQTRALDFNVELQTARKNISEMAALLGSSFGAIFTPFLEEFNKWVKDYEDILTDILTFGDNWTGKMGKILAGRPQETILQPGLVEWGVGPYTTKADTGPGVTAGGVEASISQISSALNRLKKTGKPLKWGDVSPGGPDTPWGGLSTAKAQTAYAENLLKELNKDRVRAFYNETFEGLIIGASRTKRSGYTPTMDFSDTGSGTLDYVKNENRAIDWATSRAIEKYLSTATASEVDQLLGNLKAAAGKAVPVEGIPGLEDKYYGGKRMLTDEDFQYLMQFIMKNTGQKDVSALPIQQSNSIQLSFPGVSTQQQGEEVGRGLVIGLGQKLTRAFELSDLSVGDWA